MTRSAFLRSVAILFVVVLGSATLASATPVPVFYSTPWVPPIAYQADHFLLTGQLGTLTLDTVSTTTAPINTALFVVGNSGLFDGSQSLTLSFALTLGNVTHLLSQSATWTITPDRDWFVALTAPSPVRFDTSLGSWDVTLNGYTFNPTGFGPFCQPVTATFAPVPETSTFTLFATGLIALVALSLKKVL